MEVRKYKGQTTLKKKINVMKCLEWGYPITELDVKMFVKYDLDKSTLKNCIDNCPGIDWVNSFLKRQKSNYTLNVSRRKKELSPSC